MYNSRSMAKPLRKAVWTSKKNPVQPRLTATTVATSTAMRSCGSAGSKKADGRIRMFQDESALRMQLIANTAIRANEHHGHADDLLLVKTDFRVFWPDGHDLVIDPLGPFGAI